MDAVFFGLPVPSMEHSEETIAKVIVPSQFWETHQHTKLNARQRNILHLILDDFFGKLNVSKYAKINKTSTDTALRDLQDLVQKGVLVQEGAGRSTAYAIKN